MTWQRSGWDIDNALSLLQRMKLSRSSHFAYMYVTINKYRSFSHAASFQIDMVNRCLFLNSNILATMAAQFCQGEITLPLKAGQFWQYRMISKLDYLPDQTKTFSPWRNHWYAIFQMNRWQKSYFENRARIIETQHINKSSISCPCLQSSETIRACPFKDWQCSKVLICCLS